MSFTPSQISVPAFGDPWVDKEGVLTTDATTWILQTLIPALQQSPSLSGGAPAFSETGQNAAIAPTSLALGTVSTGLYRISVYIRVTSADGVASSIAPIVTFTDGAVAASETGSALTSDNIALPGWWVFIIAVDQPGPIDISTTYSSNTPGLMQYKISVVAERL